MQLTILGSGGGWPRPGLAASGYLLRHEGFVLWLDAGTGTLANLQEHVELLDVDAVVVSHRHFDHFLDLYPYFLALWFDQRRTHSIPLFAPPGMFEHAVQLEENLSEVFESRVVGPGDRRQIAYLEDLAIAQCDGACHAVLQFAHITGPVVLEQAFHRGVG